jgi:hypothetical protein
MRFLPVQVLLIVFHIEHVVKEKLTKLPENRVVLYDSNNANLYKNNHIKYSILTQ